MITIKRIPTEPETYEVWLIPESVGFDASFGVRGAVQATAEDLPGERARAELEEANRVLAETGAPLVVPLIARVHWLASDRVQLRHALATEKQQRQEVEAERDRFFRAAQEAIGLRARLSAANAELDRLRAAFDAATAALAELQTAMRGAREGPDAASLRIQADIEKTAWWPPR